IAFINTTDVWWFSAAYALWLVYMSVLVFATVQIFTAAHMPSLMRWYLFSFAAISAFGLFQFFASFIGIQPPLIAQWWPATGAAGVTDAPDTALMSAIVPRINGLSSEPSVFATYIAIGWTMTTYLRRYRCSWISTRALRIYFLLESAALVLCSARTAWLAM